MTVLARTATSSSISYSSAFAAAPDRIDILREKFFEQAIIDFLMYPEDVGRGNPLTGDYPEYTYTVDGNTYDTGYFKIPYTHPMVFDTVGYTFPAPGTSIIEYFWNFGDGDYAYGPVVTHTFRAPNASNQVILRVRDSKSREFFIGRRTYLIVP
jgi:hypothetical protein